MPYPAKGKRSIKLESVSILAKRKTWIIIGIGLGLLIIGIYFIFVKNSSPSSAEGSTTVPPGAKQITENPNLDHLVGRWLRPDGGYILEIRHIGQDGKLDIGYYNPNPIKIGRAAWAEKDGKYYIMVELQDINYPGSTYGLEYILSQDKFAGTYYQAVEKNTYDVEFVREK
ncbi:MAG TPA: hypothetical protein VGK46_04140 [Saprospiraceae bacterium]